MKIIQLLKLLFLIEITIAQSLNMVESVPEPDFIECYWCNSRDIYCGKRVTDTMVTTIKCPKHSKCAVYTNPYDNYYLHRGCTYGMDLGEVEIENGCFVEEDGSTYCFCDFNRCNAAGILDLRNLIDDKNDTFKSFKSLSKNTRDNNLNVLKSKNSDKSPMLAPLIQRVSASSNQNFSNDSKYASYLTYPTLSSTLRSSQTTQSSTKIFNIPTTTTINDDPNEKLDVILKNLFGSSKSDKSNLIKERIRNSSNPEKLIKKFEKYTMSLLKNQNRFNYTQNNQSQINYLTPPTTTTLKSRLNTQPFSTTLSQVSFTRYQNEYERINATFYKFTLPTTTTTANNVNNMPSLYKLNINDSLSKNLIENQEFRSRFGLKPKEKLNLLLLKKPATEDGQQDIELLVNHNDLNKNLNETNQFQEITSVIEKTITTPLIKTSLMTKPTSTHILSTSTTAGTISNTKYSQINIPNNDILISANTNDNAWLAKLRAKLSSSPTLVPFQSQQQRLQQNNQQQLQQNKQQQLQQNQQHQQEEDLISQSQPERFQKYPKTDVVDTYKWSYVLSDQYRQGINHINFKCPRDGLFNNPINCAQFLQCVYFGTVYERYYVFNCPAGLYFNSVLEMCDYPQNVNCPY